MIRPNRNSWFGLIVLSLAIEAGAADFDPATDIYRSGFEISMCSNGLVEDAEQCDDNNLLAADGCSANCRIESGFVCHGSPSTCTATTLFEVEPNNSLAQADANGAGITTSTTMLGAISPFDDLDYFRVTVSNAFRVIRFESFAPANGDCTGGVGTTLRLRDAAGTQIVTDSNSGIAGCSALVFGMAPAFYYIQIEDFGKNNSIASYALQTKFLDDFGTETEPSGTTGGNETAVSAEVALAGTLDGVVFGDHTVSADIDYYVITVPAGASLRAETIEGNRQVTTCESNNLDSLLTLYGTNGTTVLATDDDDGRGFCSLIDGTGTGPPDAAARNTTGTAQTWYLAVRASSMMGAASSFTYRLAITIR